MRLSDRLVDRGRRLRLPVPSVSALLAAWGCAAALAACGSSTPGLTGQGTTPTGNSSPIALSKCMRSHGLSNFPDPTAGPGGEGFNGIDSSPGSDSLTVDGITFSGPALQAAQKACRAMLPGGAGRPPPISAAQRRQMIADAQCMRKHGVANFPDPTFPGGGGVAVKVGAGVNPQSPAFKQAAAVCLRRS